jgi:ElaB/YqjD/DUF883 family membrane-anchored ribosome-binding protein
MMEHEQERERPSGAAGEQERIETGDTGGDMGVVQERVKETSEEYIDRAQQAASQAGERVQDTAERRKEQLVGGLDYMADTLRDRTGASEGMAGRAGEKAAGTAEAAAGYLRQHSTQEIWTDLQRYVRDHPRRAIAGAVIGGFLIGRMLR